MSCEQQLNHLLISWFIEWLHHHVYSVRYDREYNLCFDELYEYVYDCAAFNKYGLWIEELYEYEKYSFS